MKAAFNYAYDDGKLVKNPIRKLKKFKIKKFDYKILDYSEIALLLSKAVYNLQAYTLLHTAIYTGIRQGELRALKWENVNLEKKQIYICETRYKSIKTYSLNL